MILPLKFGIAKWAIPLKGLRMTRKRHIVLLEDITPHCIEQLYLLGTISILKTLFELRVIIILPIINSATP